MSYFFIKKRKQLLCKYTLISSSWKLILGFGLNYGIKQEFWCRDFTSETYLNIGPTSLATSKKIWVKNLEILQQYQVFHKSEMYW